MKIINQKETTMTKRLAAIGLAVALLTGSAFVAPPADASPPASCASSLDLDGTGHITANPDQNLWAYMGCVIPGATWFAADLTADGVVTWTTEPWAAWAAPMFGFVGSTCLPLAQCNLP